MIDPSFGVRVMVPNVIINPLMIVRGDQFRYPVSKKRRIRKKWAGRERNFRRVPDPNIYEMGKGTFICHPVHHVRLSRCLRETGYVYPLPVCS